jgi:tetratricopeptide (TPR) repeat protein
MLTSPRCAAALSILVLAAGLGGAASAAEPEPPTSTVPAAKRQSAAPPPPEAVAAGRAFFEKGQAYYKAGKYQAAWVEFSSAFQIVELPDLLFNIARCEAQMGRKADAAKHYRQFLAERPDDPEAENIRKQIDALEGRVPPPVLVRPARPIPWIAAVTGGGRLAARHRWCGCARSRNSTYYSLQSECGTACSPSLTESGRTQSAVGYALLGVGFAAMAAAAIVLPIELTKKDSAAQLTATLSPSGFAVLGRF